MTPEAPESEVYQAAVRIGENRQERERWVVKVILICACILGVLVLASNGVSIYLQRQQSADLHRSVIAQQSRSSRQLAAKAAHGQALVVASARGIRCILTIPPTRHRTYRQEQRLISSCFRTFDRLNRHQK